MKIKKAIIFGGLGFIGYHLSKELCSKGFKCDVVDLKPNSFLEKKLKKNFKKNISFYKLDISKTNLSNLFKANYDYIFDCAAILGVDRIIKNSYSTFLNNLQTSINISLFAKKQKKLIKIIFMSSSEIYDGGLKFQINQPPNKEDSVITLSDINHPRTTYMFSKILGEMLNINSKIPYLNLRLHNIFGPRMHSNHSIPTFIKKLSSGKKLKIFNKNHVRSYIYIDEAIDQILSLSLKKNLIKKTFNIGSRKNIYTNNEIANLLKKSIKSKSKISFSTDKKNSINQRIPSLNNLSKEIKINKDDSLLNDLNLTIKYYAKKTKK